MRTMENTESDTTTLPHHTVAVYCMTLTFRSIPHNETRFYKEVSSRVLNYLRRRCDGYIFYPEYSKAYRLHLHGVYTGTRAGMLRFRSWWTKYYGFIMIKPCTSFLDKIGYLLYSTKQWRLNEEIYTKPMAPANKLRVSTRSHPKGVRRYYN